MKQRLAFAVVLAFMLGASGLVLESLVLAWTALTLFAAVLLVHALLIRREAREAREARRS